MSIVATIIYMGRGRMYVSEISPRLLQFPDVKLARSVGIVGELVL